MATYGSIRYSGIEDAGISGSGGVESYADVNALPASPTVGDLALVSSTNKLYVYDGSLWFNIAIVNQAPTAITGNEASYVLALDGTPTVVTLVSTDPEGFPLTWSATTSGDTQVGTVTNTDNVFTVTPSTDTANNGTLSVTFSVTDGSNTETSVSLFTLSFLSPLWDETVLSIETSSTNGLANSTFVDRSTNAHTVTPTGSPIQTAFHPYLSQYSLYLDGSGDWLRDDTIGDEIQTAFEDSGVTIEFWALPQFSDNSPVVIGSNSSTGGNEFLLQCDSVALYSNSSFSSHSYSSGMNRYEWNHYVIQFDLNDSRRISVWINGSRVLNMTRTGWFNIANNSFGFGSESDNGYWSNLGNYWNGYLFDMRMTTGPVYGDVDTIDVPTTVQPTLQDTFVHIFKSNNWSNEGRTWQDTGGTPTISSYTPFGQESEYVAGENKGSVYLEAGTNSYIAFPVNSTNYEFTGDFSVEFWYYPTGVQNDTYSSIFSISDTSNDGIAMISHSKVIIRSNTTSDIINSDVDIMKLNEWSHVVITRSGTALNIFVNGTSVHSATTSATIFDDSVTDGFIGRRVSSVGAHYAYGYVADLRVIKGSATYTTTFTPPTSPVGNTNASLYLPMDNAGIYDKTGNNTLTLVGNTSTSTTQTKFADTAMYFDGSGDKITITDHEFYPNKNLESFTIEGWIYPINSSRSLIQTIVSSWSQNPGSEIFILALTTSAKLVWYWEPVTNAEAWLTSSITVASNQWTHVAVTRDSSTNTHTLYINGQNVAQAVDTTTTTDSYQIDIGYYGTNIGTASQGSWWEGYIENLQILKGVAKYTTNFTPPNREQGRTYQAES